MCKDNALCLQNIPYTMIEADRIPCHCNVPTVSPVLKNTQGFAQPEVVFDSLLFLTLALPLLNSLNMMLVGPSEEGLRCEANNGLWPGYSTLHYACINISAYLDRALSKWHLSCYLLDLSKAFDPGPRYAL